MKRFIPILFLWMIPLVLTSCGQAAAPSQSDAVQPQPVPVSSAPSAASSELSASSAQEVVAPQSLAVSAQESSSEPSSAVSSSASQPDASSSKLVPPATSYTAEELERAAHAPDEPLSVQVVDADGNPVPNLTLHYPDEIGFDYRKFIFYAGGTDTQGRVTPPPVLRNYMDASFSAGNWSIILLNGNAVDGEQMIKQYNLDLHQEQPLQLLWDLETPLESAKKSPSGVFLTFVDEVGNPVSDLSVGLITFEEGQTEEIPAAGTSNGLSHAGYTDADGIFPFLSSFPAYYKVKTYKGEQEAEYLITVEESGTIALTWSE